MEKKDKMEQLKYRCDTCGDWHSISLSLTEGQRAGREPILLMCPDLDRRFRLSQFFIDTTRNILSPRFPDKDKDSIIKNLKDELGTKDFEAKLERWRKLQYPELGIIAEYIDTVQQIIYSYSAGYFYPSVTSACCLAERIANILILKTKDHHKSSSYYKRIHRHESITDWDLFINILSNWDLVPKVAIDAYKNLKKPRHQTIHYGKIYDFESTAHEVINNLLVLLSEIFGVINRKDIFLIFDVPGEIWVRKSAEAKPFVREFILPSCYSAHPGYRIDEEMRKIVEIPLKKGNITDAEFVSLRNDFLNKNR